jgi:hypothetical protein
MRMNPAPIAKTDRSSGGSTKRSLGGSLNRSAGLSRILFRTLSAASAAARMAALVSAATATIAAAQPGEPVQTVYVTPNQAESGKPFQVFLSGKTSLCAPQFSRHEAKAENGVVNFTVMAVSNPAANCTGEVTDFKTEFVVPGLKAGEYKVEARLYPSCHYDNPPCAMLRDPVEYGGLLYMQDSAKLAFAIRPDKVAADKPFDLFLTGKNFTCGNEYTGLTSTFQGEVLFLYFTNRPHPEVLCPAVLLDYGPTFHIPAAQAGVYQVMASVSPYCGTAGPCPLALIAPQLAGTLTVGEGPLSLRPGGSSRERGGAGTGKGAPGAAMRHGELRLDPRQGAMIRWNDGNANVTGRRR